MTFWASLAFAAVIHMGNAREALFSYPKDGVPDWGASGRLPGAPTAFKTIQLGGWEESRMGPGCSDEPGCSGPTARNDSVSPAARCSLKGPGAKELTIPRKAACFRGKNQTEPRPSLAKRPRHPKQTRASGRALVTCVEL